MTRTVHVLPVNRVEGDLEIRVEVEDGHVAEAYSMGIMYRGFENMLIGRSALDGLVITPRVCGICSTSHLMAAARALDAVYNVRIPDTAVRIRNITLGVEMLQNDIRHAFHSFMPDFTRPGCAGDRFYEEAVRRYEPFKGETVSEAIAETARLLEIIGIMGGQWPHSSFMVPGGVVSAPGGIDIAQCRFLLKRFRHWYERRVLGCRLEEWADVKSRKELEAWFSASSLHRRSEVGFFLRLAKQAGLDRLGKGHGNYISFGSMTLPAETSVTGCKNSGSLLPAGFAFHSPRGIEIQPLNPDRITEDVSCSWLKGGGEGVSPFFSITQPYATGGESAKYSWAKAPRYTDLPAETGPLAEMIVLEHPLFTDLVSAKGPDSLVRQLARMVRPALLIPVIDLWLEEIIQDREKYYQEFGETPAGEGAGLVNAPRGALGHWVRIEDSKIAHYQIITPSAWNASARDGRNVRGPWEEALIGTPLKDPDDPVEIHHVIHSFDPCLVCTVHQVRGKGAGGVCRVTSC